MSLNKKIQQYWEFLERKYPSPEFVKKIKKLEFNELKKKYDAKVIGFKGDKERIPAIDILVENNQVWKQENFEAMIYHIPGHTSGHIAYHFYNEKKK